MTQREPWQMSFDDFTGPAVITEAAATEGRHPDYDDWLWPMAGDPDTLADPAWLNDEGYRICLLIDCEPAGTFVLLDSASSPCGFYYASGLWIDPDHRGKGLSTPLILTAAAFHGGSPTNNTEGLGFSKAGYAAHRAAHRSAVMEAVAEGKDVPSQVRAEYALEEVPAMRS
jgi:hypothetical protein